MFQEQLIKIWEKVIQDNAISLWEKFVLWVNHLGFIGAGYAAVGITFLFKWLGNGTDFNLIVFTIMATLFVHKNITYFEMLYKKMWNKLFPKGIVLPYINKTIK